MKYVALVVTFAAILAAPALAQEDYPSREIRIICPSPPGGSADAIDRYFAEKLKVLTGKPVLVDNKPGAAGTLAHTHAAKAKPDGYTVYPVSGPALASSLYTFKTPPVDPLKDFEPLTAVLRHPWVVAVDAKSPHKTLPQLTAYLKEKKDKASYGAATTSSIITAELYKSIAGLDTVQVSYKAFADTLNDLSSGALDFIVADAGFALGQQQQGKVRILAISTGQRAKATGDIPTMAESGVPGVDVTVWWSVQVPAGTPKQAVDKLQAWFTEIVSMPETEQFLATLGMDAYKTTPAETRALLVEEIKRWRDYVRLAKIDPS